MSHIPISSFVTVSISTPTTALAVPAINNVAILDKESPVNSDITQTNPGIYNSPLQVLEDWGANSEAYAQAEAIFSQNPTITSGGGVLIIYPMQSGDTLSVAMTALQPLQYFGCALWAGYTPNDAEVIAGAQTAETLTINLIASSYQTSSLTTTTGLFWIIQDDGLIHTDCLLYLIGGDALSARLAAAAYAGRKRSVDFNGSLTTATMHGKALAGIAPDTLITSTILNTCQTIGVQTYVSVGQSGQYVGVVYSAPQGGPGGLFPDSVYNRDWLQLALQTSVFDVIVANSTKVPQTEQGIALLRGACINVLNQGVTNGYLAPGQWNSSTVFGNPDALRRSVANVGYYIYSQPVAQQSQQARAARQAPVIQIAAKEAGAVQSSNIIGYIEQ